jgi:hypothetical protein
MNNNGGVCPANFPHLDALWFGDDTHPSSRWWLGHGDVAIMNVTHPIMDIKPQSWWFILSVLKCQTTSLECSAEGLQFKRKWRGTPLVNHLVIWIGVNFQPNSLKVTHRWDHHTIHQTAVMYHNLPLTWLLPNYVNKGRNHPSLAKFMKILPKKHQPSSTSPWKIRIILRIVGSYSNNLDSHKKVDYPIYELAIQCQVP